MGFAVTSVRGEWSPSMSQAIRGCRALTSLQLTASETTELDLHSCLHANPSLRHIEIDGGVIDQGTLKLMISLPSIEEVHVFNVDVVGHVNGEIVLGEELRLLELMNVNVDDEWSDDLVRTRNGAISYIGLFFTDVTARGEASLRRRFEGVEVSVERVTDSK